MAKNIEKEIADLEKAINSPATPEAQKGVMKGILEKLKAKQSSAPKKTETEPKASVKKDTTPGKIITFSDGFKWEVVPNTFAKNFWDKYEIFRLNVTEETEALVESEDDLNDTDVYAVEYKEKGKKPETKTETKKPTSEDDYDCDTLIEKEKTRRAKLKERALKKANAPKSTQATKNRDAIEKVGDKLEASIEKRLETGKVSKNELTKLIDETKALLKMLESYLDKVN